MSSDAQRQSQGYQISDSGQEIPCIALPEPNLHMEQDAEWCVIRGEDGWQELRFHDYGQLYMTPGLYERLFYDILKCNSPTTVRKLLEGQMKKAGESPETLRVFDLGAGNGMMAEELADLGIEMVVGADIIEEAALAAGRDRPGLYADYFVADLTNLSLLERRKLASFRFNALTCVAALGFGDIPPRAFAEAYNLVETNGWIAFNIRDNFLEDEDQTGFAALIRRMIDEGLFSLEVQKRYQHRVATNGEPLYYAALVGRKRKSVPITWTE